MLGVAWRFYRPLRWIVEGHTTPDDPLFTCRDLLRRAERRHIATPLRASAMERTC